MNSIALGLLMMAAAPCAAADAPVLDAQPKPAAAARAADGMAFAFYAREAASPGNIFFSPYSLRSAFAMAYEGARGSTADEMAKVFAFGSREAARAEAAELAKKVKEAAGEAEFSQANAFWAQKGYKFLPAYTKTLKDSFSAAAFNADFSVPEKARGKINAWTEKNTAGKIKELFPAGSLDPNSRLVLVNAARFKGAWQQPFRKDLTREADFFRADGKSSKAMMMSSGKPVRAGYYEDETLQALSLPYRGGTLEMLVLLPRPGRGTAALSGTLTPEKLAALRAAMETRRIQVYLPRFKFSAPYKLNAALAALGMPLAFTDAADFSGMDGTQKLYIQNAFHKAFVEVNEEGTEAAAATGVAAGIKSMSFEDAVFRADRPFVFLIEDAKSGLPLFMGRLDDPR